MYISVNFNAETCGRESLRLESPSGPMNEMQTNLINDFLHPHELVLDFNGTLKLMIRKLVVERVRTLNAFMFLP